MSLLLEHQPLYIPSSFIIDIVLENSRFLNIFLEISFTPQMVHMKSMFCLYTWMETCKVFLLLDLPLLDKMLLGYKRLDRFVPLNTYFNLPLGWTSNHEKVSSSWSDWWLDAEDCEDSAAGFTDSIVGFVETVDEFDDSTAWFVEDWFDGFAVWFEDSIDCNPHLSQLYLQAIEEEQSHFRHLDPQWPQLYIQPKSLSQLGSGNWKLAT